MAFIKVPGKAENFSHLPDKQLEYIDKKGSVQLKINELINNLELKEWDLNKRNQICKQLQSHLKEFYPHCELIIYGSSVNGFGFKGCDIDLLFLPFPGYNNMHFIDNTNDNTPSPYHVLKGKYPKENLLKMNEKSHLKFIRKVFSMKGLFEQITFIPAKCPILYLKFLQSPFECDLSASNRLVVCNTELFQLFCKMDVRVKPLVIILRYWAKSLGFICKTFLSSYAFSLLVIFALQNTEFSVLPSVKSLIDTAGFSRTINGWETAFNKNMVSLPKFNLNSLEQLMMHFLNFYWNFDFNLNIVSPYHGKPLSIEDLKKSTDERLKNFKVSTFSIQDPFILDQNLSRNASIITSFKLALYIAKQLMSKSNFSFKTFFTSDIYQKHLDSMCEQTLNYYSMKYDVCTICPTDEIISKLGIVNNLKPWFEKVSHTVLDVLSYGLLMECEVIDKIIWDDKTTYSPPTKKRKINDLDSLTQMDLLMSIQCTVYFNTWDSRKKHEFSSCDTDLDIPDILKKEYSLSQTFLPESSMEVKSPILWFICDCYKYPVDYITDVVVILSPLDKNTYFHQMSHVLKSYLRKTVYKVLKET